MIKDDFACFFSSCRGTQNVPVGMRTQLKGPKSMLKCVCCVFLLLSLSVSAEMLGYSYELDSPYSGPKNRAVPNFMMRSFVLPLQRMRKNIEV